MLVTAKKAEVDEQKPTPQTEEQPVSTGEKEKPVADTGASAAQNKPNTGTAQTGDMTGLGSGLANGYEGKYDAQLQDLYDQITQRKPFEYSTDDDMLYKEYVDRYTQGGRMAMEDTMGKAAALTGGYGSSYAQNVGQQAYDQYMTGLNDKASELYQQAYGRYQDQGNDLYQQYALLNQRADDDYGKWADSYDRVMTEAALRANSGDFGGYGQLFGDEAGARMQKMYAAQVLMPLYKNGQIDAEAYKNIAGEYPVGYQPGGAADAGYLPIVGGSYDPRIAEQQRILNSVFGENLVVDGVDGPKTQNAYAYHQAEYEDWVNQNYPNKKGE